MKVSCSVVGVKALADQSGLQPTTHLKPYDRLKPSLQQRVTHSRGLNAILQNEKWKS
jgi:hypothetical protein